MSEKNKSQETEASPESQESKRIDQEIVREQKMDKLAQAGIDLFPHHVEITNSIF